MTVTLAVVTVKLTVYTAKMTVSITNLTVMPNMPTAHNFAVGLLKNF